MRVLVVDDDRALLRALTVALRSAGHEVITATTGGQGIAAAAADPPDVVVLDLGLPDIDGIAVCRQIRSWSEVPIIVLSATDAELRKVAALDGGADDYVTKPFGMAELEARMRAALRHRQPLAETEPELVAGPLRIDLVHREASVDGRALHFTSRELDLLAFLARNQGRVSTHQMILRAVWGTGYGNEKQYLHAYVHRLRQKLGAHSGVSIENVSGIGYSLLTAAPPSS